MVLESIMVCVDNSEYMWNGDFLFIRLQVQQDVVNIVCYLKICSNFENNVGFIILVNDCEVLIIFILDIGCILFKLYIV